MSDKILFYKVNEPYGVFSNFYKCGFFIDDEYWPTVEHFFQAQKFDDEALRKKSESLRHQWMLLYQEEIGIIR